VIEELTKRTYRGQRLVIRDDGQRRVFLGPDLHLVDCEVVFECAPRSIGLAGVTMENCRVRAGKRVQHVDFVHARLVGCSFAGSFSECDFGHLARMDDFGFIADCDFTDAALDDCRFFDCALDSLRFAPQWPQIVFERFQGPARELLQMARNVDEKIFLQMLAEEPEEEVAQCVTAKTLAKRLRVGPDRVPAVIRSLPFACPIGGMPD
jgi:hypothetical protein